MVWRWFLRVTSNEKLFSLPNEEYASIAFPMLVRSLPLTEWMMSPFFTPMLFGLGAINLAKNPDGYCGIGGTGVSCPVGAGVSAPG